MHPTTLFVPSGVSEFARLPAPAPSAVKVVTIMTFAVMAAWGTRKVYLNAKISQQRKTIEGLIAKLRLQMALSGTLDEEGLKKIRSLVINWKDISLAHFEVIINFLAALPLTVFAQVFSESTPDRPLLHNLISEAAFQHLTSMLVRLAPEQKKILFKMRDKENCNFLHIACACNTEELISFLLKHVPTQDRPEYISQKNSSGDTPWLQAYLHDYAFSAKAMLRSAKAANHLVGLLKQTSERDQSNVFQKACFFGRTPWITLLLNSLEPDERLSLINLEREELGDDPLYLALQESHFETIQEILHLCPQALYRASKRFNLLHLACWNGKLELFSHVQHHLELQHANAAEEWRKLLFAKSPDGLALIDLLAMTPYLENPSEDMQNHPSRRILVAVKQILPSEEFRKWIFSC